VRRIANQFGDIPADDVVLKVSNGCAGDLVAPTMSRTPIAPKVAPTWPALNTYDNIRSFIGGDELLGQQVAEPAGTLDRPRPLLEWRRPLHQPLDLADGRAHPKLTELLLVVVRDAAVRDASCGLMPIITAITAPFARSGS
jgi:hypothetical protein